MLLAALGDERIVVRLVLGRLNVVFAKHSYTLAFYIEKLSSLQS